MKTKIISAFFFLFIVGSLMLTSCLKPSDDNNTLEKELEYLESYLKGLVTGGYDVDTTASGVYYVRKTEGTGPFPEAGDTISVKYVGYLMNGAVFDASFYTSADSAWTYVYKTTPTIKGWEDMMALMNKNCKMEFAVPSELAYGSEWVGTIPPYSTLVFVAIMADVKKKVN
jgi:FKBP-type peptidyl-prolyl cis-trans isomerase